MNLSSKSEQDSFFVTKQDIIPMVNCLEIMLKKIEVLESMLAGEIYTPSELELMRTIELNHKEETWRQLLEIKVHEQKGFVYDIHRNYVRQQKRTIDASARIFAFIEDKIARGEIKPLHYLPYDHMNWEVKLFRILNGNSKTLVGVKGKMVVLHEIMSNLLKNINTEDRGKFFDHDQTLIDWVLEKRETWGYSRGYSLLTNTIKTNQKENIAIFDQGRFYYIVDVVGE